MENSRFICCIWRYPKDLRNNHRAKNGKANTANAALTKALSGDVCKDLNQLVRVSGTTRQLTIKVSTTNAGAAHQRIR